MNENHKYAGQEAVVVNKVGKVIDNGKKKFVILRDVSFSLEKGTVAAIVGKSGSGKSTLLSVVSGIDAPSSGSVRLLGKDYHKLTPREQQRFRNKHIGLLFQNYHLIPELTCEENIRVPKCFSREPADEKRLEEWIKRVGLEDKRNLFPRQLSGGEQQRTAILRALINSPDLLFADEPTGALDSKTGENVIKFLIQYAHLAKMTILLVTHDMDVAGMCDCVIGIADGSAGSFQTANGFIAKNLQHG